MLRVIVADDEKNIRDGIVELIDWNILQCRVIHSCGNGRDVLNLMEQEVQPVDIVITDIKMPLMDGLALSEIINKSYPSTSVIILTAYSDFSFAQNAIKNGVSDIYNKLKQFDKNEEITPKQIFIEIQKSKTRFSLFYITINWLEKCHQLTLNNQKYQNPLVMGANQYIQENYKNRISLQDISAKLFTSSSYLSRIYKKETGTNLSDAINLFRIKKAKQLLLNRQHKVYEVGGLVGIDDAAYFSHLFIKYVKKTPKEFQIHGE